MLPHPKRKEQSVHRDHIGRLGFKIPENEPTTNGLIGGLKEAVDQIYGAILGSLMKALEEHLINEMIQNHPERYRRNGNQSKPTICSARQGSIALSK